jgi:hypothetical protein
VTLPADEASSPCPACGADNPAAGYTCISCGQELPHVPGGLLLQPASAERSQPADDEPPIPPMPFADNPLTVDDFGGLRLWLMLIPVVGLGFAIYWIIQRRGGAWGCLVAMLLYIVLLWALNMLRVWVALSFGPTAGGGA